MLFTKAQKLAAQIDALNENGKSAIISLGTEAWRLANTPGQEQAVMDVLGTNAYSALVRYTVLHTAATLLAAIERGQAADVGALLAGLNTSGITAQAGFPAPDLERFVPQEGGAVQYVEQVDL